MDSTGFDAAPERYVTGGGEAIDIIRRDLSPEFDLRAICARYELALYRVATYFMFGALGALVIGKALTHTAGTVLALIVFFAVSCAIYPCALVIESMTDAVKAAEPSFRGYCKGASKKYVLRAGKKGPAANDYEKARWYTGMSLHVQDPDRWPDPRKYRDA